MAEHFYDNLFSIGLLSYHAMCIILGQILRKQQSESVVYNSTTFEFSQSVASETGFIYT